MKQKVMDLIEKMKGMLVAFKDYVVSLKNKVTKETLYWLVPALVIVVGLVTLVALPSRDGARETVGESDDTEELATTLEGIVAGTYTSGMLPAASTPGREFELALADDGRAIFTADYKTGDRLVVETGTWEEADGRITVTLTTRFGNPIAEPLVLTFATVEEKLSLVDYDRSRWGALGLTLSRNK